MRLAPPLHAGGLAAAPRVHYASDVVFTALAAEILRGDLAPGDVLPAERLLSDRFRVSKLLVRQAIHRLADAGLVEARQGGATRVLDARASGDLRVIELYYRLAPDARAARELARDVLEKQFTQGMSLLEVCARRGSGEQRAALVDLVEGVPAAARDRKAFEELEARFWLAVAEAGKNRILLAEVRWWYGALAARPEPPDPAPLARRYAFYRELAHRLREADGALAFYVAALAPFVEALFARKGRTAQPSKQG
jgi:GntR family transcriptional repressor for pyruvate dehydrogenase complex